MTPSIKIAIATNTKLILMTILLGPSAVVDDLKLKAGDDMLLDVKDSNIVVRKKK